MNRVPMTQNGAKALQEELNQLKNEKRPQIITAISEARAHGDLKENAEYHAAKEMQSFIEGRIKEIESKLSHAQVIDITTMPNNGKIIFGTTVHLLNLQSDEKIIYKIVGDDEADVKASKVSVSSPIARALIGKQSGDEVNVQTPAGMVEYEIVKVEYI
jgi:transcription elongation factor GreA